MSVVHHAATPEHRIYRREQTLPPSADGPAPVQTAADRVLALQRSAGNAAVARALLARRFDRAAYERSMADKAKFMAWLWEGPSWHPSTGLGNFDILYEPKTGLLTVTVKCRFKFIDGKASDWEDLDIDPDEVKWDDAAKVKWKRDFTRRVSAFWSDHFTFHCTRDWWEDLHAVVKVKFVESSHKNSHYDLNVTKIPDAAFRRSSVRRLKGPAKHGKSYMNSEDLSPAVHTGEREQTPAYHEAGHMLGLGDEYHDKKHTGPVAHDKLVRAEFGHGAPLADVDAGHVVLAPRRSALGHEPGEGPHARSALQRGAQPRDRGPLEHEQGAAPARGRPAQVAPPRGRKQPHRAWQWRSPPPAPPKNMGHISPLDRRGRRAFASLPRARRSAERDLRGPP
jgi:hypothetical protein